MYDDEKKTILGVPLDFSINESFPVVIDMADNTLKYYLVENERDIEDDDNVISQIQLKY